MRKMILAMATDIRVIMVKLADRLHNMETLGFQTLEKQTLIARETLDIYAPLAGRMGIHWLKSNLEDLCLFYLEPEIYEAIKSGIAERRGTRETFIQEVKEIITKKLEEDDIKATIRGRHKHFYSIYKKMSSSASKRPARIPEKDKNSHVFGKISLIYNIYIYIYIYI